MRDKLLLPLIIILLFPLLSTSQEVLTDLSSNPIISAKYKQGGPKAATGDTLQLPFVDDFSKLGVYPDPALWIDSFAFINTNYAANPTSLGVATLDGLNFDGMPYQFVINQPHGKADELTSKYIDISGFTPSDSLYFSFFYQPQGLGNAPEFEDSLVLQFAIPTDTTPDWKSVWKTSGSSIPTDSSFTQVFIPFLNEDYFTNAFQFRFVNYATLSGNVDHWHLDYIRFNEGRSVNDTASDDAAFVYNYTSILKEYQAMPWTHYQNNAAEALGDSIYIYLHNIDDEEKPVSYQYFVFDQDNTLLHNSSIDAVDVYPSTYCTNAIPVDCSVPMNQDFTNFFNYAFPTSYSGDVVSFRLEGHFTFPPNTTDINANNDTLKYEQKFANYYAYDDGTAENAYGLNVAGARLAYRFKLNKADTIRGVQMYFNPILLDVSDRNFQLAVWAGDQQPIGDPIYVSDSLYTPHYRAFGQNSFWTYEFDSTFVLDGTFFVGWIQESNDLLNIGLDRNINANDKMFFSLEEGGNWNQSNLKGAWMIRPLFGDVLPDYNSVSEYPQQTQVDFNVFPNPSNGIINILPKGQVLNTDYRMAVFNSMGQLIMQENSLREQLDLSALPKGFYFLTVSDRKGQSSYTYKIILR